MTPRLILSLVIALAGFAAGWLGNGWRLGQEIESIHNAYAWEDAARTTAELEQRAKLAQERDALADRLHQADQTHTAQLQKARHENKTLADSIAAGTVGLRIDATCTGAGQAESAKSGSVDSPAGAQLSPAAGRAYSALRESITTTEITLSACQGALSELQ